MSALALCALALALIQLPGTLWLVRLRLAVPADRRAWITGAVEVALAARGRVAVERRPDFDCWLTHGGRP
jgi:hypothetical protein